MDRGLRLKIEIDLYWIRNKNKLEFSKKGRPKTKVDATFKVKPNLRILKIQMENWKLLMKEHSQLGQNWAVLNFGKCIKHGLISININTVHLRTNSVCYFDCDWWSGLQIFGFYRNYCNYLSKEVSTTADVWRIKIRRILRF